MSIQSYSLHQTNDMGDTLKVVQITDRDRARARVAVRDKEERLVVRTDTVYIEKRDSSLRVLGRAKRQSRATAYGLQEDGTDERSKCRAKLAWAMPCKEEEKRSLTPTISGKQDSEMVFLDTHRPYRPDCNGKGLLTEMVSGPFVWGEGRKNDGILHF